MKQINTPNVAPLIHRLVNDANWVEDTSIIFHFVGEGSMGEVYAFDTDESIAAVLKSCDYIEVTIIDVNEPPSVKSGKVCTVNEAPYDATESQLMSLEHTIVCKVVLSDPDINSKTIEWKTHQWSAVDAENNNMPFYIGGNGNIRIRNPEDLDFEMLNEYTMLLMVAILSQMQLKLRFE